MKKKAKKKEAIGMMMQCKEGRRESCHKFPGANDDMDITHSIWLFILNSSFLLVCTTLAPNNDCTLLYYFPTKGQT